MPNKENLFIVVRHKDHIEQKFENVWIDDRRLKSITTTKSVLNTCEDYLRSGADDWIYVYRTAMKGKPRRIVSRCKIDKIDFEEDKVFFKGQEILDAEPPFKANAKTYIKFNSASYGLSSPPPSPTAPKALKKSA